MTIIIMIIIIMTIITIVMVIVIITERVLEYGCGLRFSTEIYRRKRQNTVFHKYLQEHCFVFTGIFKNLQRPPGVYRRM